MKTFANLKKGDRIYNPIDGIMEVLFWDIYGDGEDIMCFAGEKSIWSSYDFNPADWELVTE